MFKDRNPSTRWFYRTALPVASGLILFFACKYSNSDLDYPFSVKSLRPKNLFYIEDFNMLKMDVNNESIKPLDIPKIPFGKYDASGNKIIENQDSNADSLLLAGTQSRGGTRVVRPADEDGTGNTTTTDARTPGDTTAAPAPQGVPTAPPAIGGQGVTANTTVQANATQNGQPPLPQDPAAAGAQAAPGQNTPLVLDLNLDGKIKTGASETGRQLQFDIIGNGRPQNIDWVSSDDGFLCLDLDGNGKIESGRELFGSGTVMLKSKQTAINGYDALTQYDTNNDGVINNHDPIWNRLMIWQDKNRDGISQKGEISYITKTSIDSLSIKYEVTGNDSQILIGNFKTSSLKLKSYYTMKGSSKKYLLGDIFFTNVDTVDIAKNFGRAL